MDRYMLETNAAAADILAEQEASVVNRRARIRSSSPGDAIRDGVEALVDMGIPDAKMANAIAQGISNGLSDHANKSRLISMLRRSPFLREEVEDFTEERNDVKDFRNFLDTFAREYFKRRSEIQKNHFKAGKELSEVGKEIGNKFREALKIVKRVKRKREEYATVTEGKGSILVRINSKQLDVVEKVLTIEKLKKVSPPGYTDYYNGDKYKAHWKKGNELIAITETYNKNLFTYERM